MYVAEDLVVVCPGGVGEVDGFGGLGVVEVMEEESTEMEGAGAGDGLYGDGLITGCLLDLLWWVEADAYLRREDAHSLVFDRWAIGA